MNGVMRRLTVVVALGMAAFGPVAGEAVAAGADDFKILNVYINRAYAVQTFTARRENEAKIGSGEEVIALASDGLQFLVQNSGTPMVLSICGQVFDMETKNRVIGSGTIVTKNPVPTGVTTLLATDFSAASHINADPEYNLELEHQYKDASGDDVLRALLAKTYKFTVQPCGNPAGARDYVFTIMEPPYDPVRVSRPANQSSVCPQGLQFAWFQTLLEGSPAAKYRLEVFEGDDAANRIFDSGEIVGTSLIYPSNARQLERGKTYVWRVTATDSLSVRKQASTLNRFTVECGEGQRKFSMADFVAELRRTRPDLFGGLGNLTLVSVDAPTLGPVDGPKFQGLTGDLAKGKAKVKNASTSMGDEGGKLKPLKALKDPKPAKPGKPEKPADQGKPDKPADLLKPDKPADQGKPDKPADPGKPDKGPNLDGGPAKGGKP